MTSATGLAASGLAQEPERIWADADRERRERAEQQLVVQRVRDDAEEPDQVLDLLLGPVAAAADHERAEAGARQRLLVGVDVGEGAQQDDDLATLGIARLDQLAKSLGKEAGLGDHLRRGGCRRRIELDLVGVPLARLAPLALVERQQQLDRSRPIVGIRPALSSAKPSSSALPTALTAPAPPVASGSCRAAAARLGPDPSDRVRALLAKDLEVGVAEAVDRLVLVADHEHLGLRAAKLLDQLELDAVGVLELVDHDVLEALAPDRRQRVARAQERERAQLEVEEVERRPLFLERLVAGVEALEQRFEGGAGRLCGGHVRGRKRIHQLLPLARGVKRLAHLRQAGLGHSLAAQLHVRGERHLLEAPGLVLGRRDGNPLIALDQQGVERIAEGAIAQATRLTGVEHAKRGIEPGRERVHRQQAATEGVDRHHPGALGGAGEDAELVGQGIVALPARDVRSCGSARRGSVSASRPRRAR